MTGTQQRRLGGGSETSAVVSLAATETRLQPAPAGALLRAEVARLLARIDTAEPIRRRVVQEAMNDALACTWRNRAAAFTWAMSRPGDFTGNATPAELRVRDRKLAAQARACLAKATLLELGLLDDFEGEL